MRSSRHYDVAVIGAGPTGLVLANLLGMAGVRTLLVEARPATVSEPRAVSIDDETLRVVQRLGLLEVVSSQIVSGYGSDYLGPDGRLFLQVKPKARPYGHPRRNAFRQPVFEAQLRDGLSRFAGVETEFSCRAEGFSQRDGGVLLQLRREDQTSETVAADYLIGCDGAWSQTRETLGYTLQGGTPAERWLIIDLEDSPAASPETIVFCDHRRPGIALPGPGRTRRFEFKLHKGEADVFAVSDEMVGSLLETHGTAPGSRVVRKAVYHFHSRIADHWGRDRVWLAGDAAHLMPPFAGQGMNSGVRDAANLALKLAAIVTGRIGPRLLETYERERRRHVADMIRLALAMGEIFGPRSALHGLATRTAFRALRVWPAAEAYFAEMKYKPPPRLDGGFLVETQISRRGIVGRMLPQPPLPSRFGATTLDTLLGDGFALLGVGVGRPAVDGLRLGKAWDGLVERRISFDTADLPDFAAHAGKLLLIRPDRYVMARFAPSEAPGLAAGLDQLLQRTWSDTALSRPPDPRRSPLSIASG
jgi:3-(3-hydroxy-phenyl)propionate hydroxylase